MPSRLVRERVGQGRDRLDQSEIDPPRVELSSPSRLHPEDRAVLSRDRVAVEVGLAIDEDTLLGPRVEAVSTPCELVEHPPAQPGLSCRRDSTDREHGRIERRWK